MADPRFTVSGNDIVFAETHQPVTVQEFNKISTPEEKDAIDREFTARALKVNQADEKMINEEEVDADLAAPEPPSWKGAAWPKGWIKPGTTATSTPSEGLVDTPPSPAPTESSPAPVTGTPAPSLTGEDTLESQPEVSRAPSAGGKWKPPTLATFLDATRPENPEFDDVALAKEYRKLYPEAAELYPAPKKDEWIQSAQKENPDYSPLQLNRYYDDIYGTPPPPKADVGWIGTVVEGAKSTWRSLKAAGYATFGNLEGVEQTSVDAKSSQHDTALQEFLREASAGKREDESWFDAGKRVGSAVLAHPKGAIMSGVQQLPNVAVIGAGVEAGMLAGAPLGPGGVIAGGIAGLFLSEIALETGGKALEKADNGKFTPEERRLALEEGVVKGTITAAIDLGSFGATRWVAGTAGRAVESATARTLTDAGIDIADKAAVSAAVKSPEIAAKVVAAQEAARVAVNTLGQKVGRAGAEVLSETVGESAGEYLGELAATGKADKTEALIEGLAGFGQSAVEIGVANVRPSTPVAAVAVPPPSTGGAPPGSGEPPEAPIAPIMAQPDVDAAIKTASTVVDAPITATQLNQFLAPDQGEITKSTQQANLERIFSGFEPTAEDRQAGFTGFQRAEDGAATFNGVPLKVLSREELPLQSAPESPLISQQKYDVASLFAKAFDKELVIYQNAPGIPDGVVWRQLDPNSIYLSSESTSADTFRVIGHELMHFMEGTELHDSFRQVVTENLTAEARSVAAKRHGALDERGLLNEIGADLAGSELSKAEVWQRVFQNLSERVGTDQAKTEVLSFIDSLKDVIARIRNLIAGRPWTAGSPEVQLANAYVTNLEKIHDSLAGVVADALSSAPSPTTSETATGPQTMGDREIVHPEAVQAFTALAERQRGEPELAMRDLKDFIGGGVLSPALEHAGDLIHRVTEASRFGRANRPLVAAKVDALVQSLGHAYGFEREHQENLKARAKALRLPLSKVREQVSTGLARYAAAQKALPVYNRVHWLMREAARAIGESRFADALTAAKELQALTRSKNAFDRAAFSFTRGADKQIAQYLEPLPVKIVANKAGELDEDTLYQLTKPALGKKAGQTVRASVLKDAGYLPQPVDLARHGEAKAVEGVAKQSPQADLTEHPEARRTLSTTVPAGKKGDRNAYTQNWIIGTEDILASESHTKTLLAALHDYPMMSKEQDSKKAFTEFKRKVVANLLWLHDLVPAEARERAKRWYDGANRIATEWAEQDGYTENQHAGVLAVLSPQKDWFMNVSLADRVRTIMKEQADNPWTQEMTNWAELFRVGARTPEVKAIADKFVSASQRLEGQILKTLSNEEAALFIRAYDQTYHERSYRLVTPEGGFGEYVTNKQEMEEDLFGPIPKVKGTAAWGSQRFIEKAVSILRDGSNKNISEQLGSEHKVRNFYNNILHPNSAEGHVTIDTHAMGAALIKAVSGASLEVKQLFGAAGSNVWTGASGSYGLVADAYREAAKRRGLLPREMQSITWEAVRGLFPWSVKKQLAPKIEAVWEDVRNGKITLVKAREKIFAMSGGINRFAWEQGGEGLSPANGGVSFEKGNPNVVSTKGRQFSKRGGVPGSQGVLSEPYRPYQGTGKAGRTLDGLPALVSVDGTDVEFAGFKPAQDAAAAYMEKAGLPYHPETVYHKIDKARAARIAAAYDAMPHAPQDPEVKAAYDAMVAETLAQYEAMLETGIVIEFNDGEDPYGNPRNAILDVIENNHMYVFSTREGFGSNVQFDPKDNPLLAETKFKFGDQPTLANDIFRAVHDYFGHVKDAVGFRAEGEDNAWYSHARMFSPLARRAMTTETRGQNSWVNYGPHGEANRKANPADTIYADQKTGLLPEWVMEMDRPQASRANLVHYSKEKGLSTIDPAFHGTGQIGAERTRMLNEGKAYLPRTYFYRAGTKIEPRFKGQRKYQVQVDEDSLVDLAEFTGTPSERERAAKDAGYKGYYNSESAMPNVVAMFTPVNVSTSAQVPAHSVSELRSDPLFSPRTWVSQIEKVLELKMPKSASAAQIKGILSPQNGIKPDELEAMGIDEYLASKEKFDKHNVLEWVKAHQIQAEQITFSTAAKDIAEQVAAIDAEHDPIIAAADAEVQAAKERLDASDSSNAHERSNAYYDALDKWNEATDNKKFELLHVTEAANSKKPKYTGSFDPSNADIRFAPGAKPTGAAQKKPKSPVAPTFTVDQPGWLDKLIRILQDKNIDIKRVVEALQATGRQLAEDLNPVLKEEMYLKRAEQKSKDFTTDEMLPLTKAMKLMGATLEQMDHYLQARHIVRDNLNKRLQAINPNLAGTPEFDRLAGMTDQQAQGIVNQYARLEPLARKVDDMVDKTRDLMVSYGLEKQSTIDAWRAAYGAYVPLRREGFEDEGYPSGTGRSVRGSTAKQRLGSGLEATNILANVAQARDQVITRGEKTRPVVAMAGLLMMHPNSDLATLDKPAQIQITDPVTGVVTTVPGNLTNYQVPMVRRVDPRTGMVGLFPDPTYKGRDNVVNFRVNGEDFAIVFNERNVRAMEVAKAFKDTDTAQLTGLMAMVAPYTRYLASINTQYNPIFGVVNFARDSQFAMLALQTTPLKDKKAEVMSNTISSLRGIYQDARAVRNGQHPTSATAQMWERFQHVGGPTGYRDLFFSSTERAEEIEHLITPMTFSEIRSAKDFGRRMESTWAMQVLSDYNLTMENSIRLGVFITAVNMGISDLQAASYAKNITVNFNKRGQIGAQMGSLYAFFNANVQGTARIFETLFERTPNGVAISAAGKKVIAGGLLLGVLQTFALAMAGFGDDQPPEYIKARNIIIPMPGTEKGYVSIPMPLGFNLLPNIGRAAAETVRRGVEGKPLKLMAQTSDLISSFYGTFSPLGGSGGIVQELMPTTVDPIVSAFATNKDWTGKSIAKEDVSRLDPTPGHTRARDTATVWATALSKAINWATGGTEHSAGVLSPTPDALDYLIQQATGGVGREISKTAQVVQSQITGEELPFYKVPLLGRFGGSATGATAVRDDFYTRVKDVNIASREFAGRVKEKDPSAREFIKDNPEARLKPAADQIERKITDLQKLKHEELKRGVGADRIQQREKQITNLMLRFNQLVDRVRAGSPGEE